MFSLIALPPLAVGTALPTQAETLQETVQRALKAHPKIGAARARANAAEERIKIERGKLFPSLDVEGSTGAQYYRTPSIRRLRDSGNSTLYRNEATAIVNQLLFDGFATINLVRQAKALARAAAFRVTDERHTVALTAIAAHLDVLRHRELVRLAKRNIQNHLTILGSVRALAARGNATRADVSQALSRLEASRARLEQRNGSLLEAQARFIETVGTQPGPLAVPDVPLRRAPSSLGAALQRATHNNPEIKVASSEVRGRQYGFKSTKGLFVPRVNLELTARQGDNLDGVRGNTTDLRAIVVLRWNLYRGGSDIARRHEAKFNLRAAQADEAEARRLVRERARQAHAALVSNIRRLQKITAQVAAARRVLADYREQYRLGQRGLIDLLDGQNEVFIAQESQIDARYSILFNRFALFAATGDLLAFFRLTGESSPEGKRVRRPTVATLTPTTKAPRQGHLSSVVPKLRPVILPPAQKMERIQASEIRED